MENNQNAKNKVPFYGYLMMVFIYVAAPFSNPVLAYIVGIYDTFEEFKTFSSSPIMLVSLAICFAVGIFVTKKFKKTIEQFNALPEIHRAEIEDVNKKLKVLYKLNIILPIICGFLTSLAFYIELSISKIQLANFQGFSPMSVYFIFTIGIVFECALLFYVIMIRIVEPRLYYIPFTMEEAPLSIMERNLLTLLFAVLGTLLLFIAVSVIPSNYQGGAQTLLPRLIPLSIFIIIYFGAIEFLLISDVKRCLLDISTITGKMAEKDYTVENGKAVNRSELGTIILNINNFKKTNAGLFKEMLNTTKTSVNHSHELVTNMGVTQNTVSGITSSIDSIKAEIENQSAGVTESSAAVNQMMNTINDLNSAISNQSMNVAKSSSAVEEMVANIKNVTSILEKNKEMVDSLGDASEKGESSVKTAVDTVKNILEQSAGILQASKIPD